MSDDPRFPVTVELDADTYATFSTRAARLGLTVPEIAERELMQAADDMDRRERPAGLSPRERFPEGQAVAAKTAQGWALARVIARLADGSPIRLLTSDDTSDIGVPANPMHCLPASGVPENAIDRAAGYFPTAADLAVAATPLRRSA